MLKISPRTEKHVRCLHQEKGALAEIQVDCPHMATIVLGHRHHWTPTNNSREIEVCFRRSRILHQMDRGEGGLRYNVKHNPKNFLAEHYMQIRSPLYNNCGNDKQLDSRQFRDFCALVATKVNFASVYHPLIQQRSRKSKPKKFHGSQEKAT